MQTKGRSIIHASKHSSPVGWVPRNCIYTYNRQNELSNYFDSPAFSKMTLLSLLTATSYHFLKILKKDYFSNEFRKQWIKSSKSGFMGWVAQCCLILLDSGGAPHRDWYSVNYILGNNTFILSAKTFCYDMDMFWVCSPNAHVLEAWSQCDDVERWWNLHEEGPTLRWLGHWEHHSQKELIQFSQDSSQFPQEWNVTKKESGPPVSNLLLLLSPCNFSYKCSLQDVTHCVAMEPEPSPEAELIGHTILDF